MRVTSRAPVLIAATVLLLVLVLAPAAGASVYWTNTSTIARAGGDGTGVNQAFIWQDDRRRRGSVDQDQGCRHGPSAHQGERKGAAQAGPDRTGDGQGDGALHAEGRQAQHPINERAAQAAQVIAGAKADQWPFDEKCM